MFLLPSSTSTILFDKNFALDVENYTVSIEELSHDENFLEKYTTWSLELFSQHDYLYGNPHALLSDLINSERYEKRNDFAVVIQPFMTHNKLSYKHNNKIDFSYFAPACFHLSDKGHSLAAISLWNNLFEPVGGKTRTWHIGKPLKYHTKEYPYIFTSKNSAKALDELKSRTLMRTTDCATKIIRNTSTSDHNPTSHYHRKHKKVDSDLSHTK
ncbi:unnamed protein product [Rotaria socialis]|uniref:Uncharacterized protein n=2 Tax=Rotaria socialis TaxID=392032 RepID=A0A820XYN9_9BILA|nr:unnamed protein product [Rotaria socialis]CAF3493418.1 unnamed protein product [Rotaria socialis]CAF4459046.1 unnamed protein product [Rotaria socialis]CAF4540582.1 unnamed protein product [Rotaria socialis]